METLKTWLERLKEKIWELKQKYEFSNDFDEFLKQLPSADLVENFYYDTIKGSWVPKSTMGINFEQATQYLSKLFEIDGNTFDLNFEVATQVNKAEVFVGTLNAALFKQIGLIDSEYLFNALSVSVKTNDTNGTKFRVHLRNENNIDILVFYIKDDRPIFFDDYYFPSQKYIKVYVQNQSTTASMEYSFKFFFTNRTRNNLFTNKFGLSASETHSFEYKDTNLVNRLSYVFYKASGTQDYTIKIYTTLSSKGASYDALIKTENITGSGGIVLDGIIGFTETSNIKIEIIENAGTIGYCEFNLFFSNSILSLIQILTRNHNDLQNIGANDHISNLNQITTRNHSDLQNITTSQHHTKYTDSEAKTACVSNEVYGASWNNQNDIAPSKNAVYDKIETLGGGIGGFSLEMRPSAGCTLSTSYIQLDDVGDYIVGHFRITDIIDASQNITVLLSIKERTTATDPTLTWNIGAAKTNGTEDFSFNIANSVGFSIGGCPNIYTKTYTINAADIDQDDVVVICVYATNVYDSQIFNLSIEFTPT